MAALATAERALPTYSHRYSRKKFTPQQAWQYAAETAEPRECICIAGSFYLAAEMRPFIHAGRCAAEEGRPFPG